MSNKPPFPTGNTEFDAWWPAIREKGPSHDDWSMDDYEYHPIDDPMLDAFEAGQAVEREELAEKLKAFREEHLVPDSDSGDALSNLIAEFVCRGFKNFLERGRDIPGG